MLIGGTATQLAAVLGSPVAHSLSPVMHRAAYDRLGLTEWDYGMVECDEAALAPFLAGLDDRWRGLSLTMPLKEEALRLAATADPVARTVGGANTLVRRKDGGWDATNTDVHGITAALADHGLTSVRRVAVLGAGATARSALVAVARLGAQEVRLATRSGVRPETLRLAQSLGLATTDGRLDDVSEVVGGADLVVDTLPGDAADTVAEALSGRRLPALFEAIYEGWPTRLARTFLETDAPVVSGLEMLAHQGARQVELMTGHEIPARVLLDAASAALG